MLIIASTFSFGCKKDSVSSDNGGGQPGETQHLPYFQSFETEFGTYSTKNVIGEQEWMIEYSSAQIKGYDGGSNFDNEDWLISSKVSITGVEHAKMVMKYVARSFNGIGDCVTIWASANYNQGDMPSTAEWTRIPAELVECNSWYDISTIELNLDDFIGQTVTLAVKFTSTTEKAGGLKIVSISIEEGVEIHPGETQYLPYVQNFDAGFGTYTTKNVFGDQEWHIEYSAATMLGYDHANEYANEDWLISSPVSVTGVDHAKMTMNYVGCNFRGITNYVTVWASTDYNFGSMPSTATWTRVPAVLYESDNWYYYKTAEVDLDDYLGQTVTFAVKFISYERYAGGISIKSISIAEGEVYGGGATQNLPYVQSFETEFGTYTTKSVVGDQEWNIDYETAWMQGCIYNNGSNEYYENEDWLISSPVSLSGVQHAKIVMEYMGHYFYSSSYTIDENVTLWASTNYNYGDMPSTASWTQIPASLELSSDWTDFKTAEMNLDIFIGQTVTIAVKYLSTTSYAGNLEIKSISVEEGSANGGGETQYLPYTQSFATSFGSYTTKSVIGDQKWTIEYRTARINGYVNGVYYENEDWLISSPVSITGVSHAKMVVAYIGRYFNDINADVTILVSTNYQFGYMPSTASWTQIPSYLEQGSNWNDFLTAELSLDDYIGHTITVAVKYVSDNTSNSGSLEIQSISVEEGEVIPPTPPTPGGTIYSNSFAFSQGDFTIQDVVIPGELTYIWSHASNYSCMKASAYVGQAYDAESWLVSPYIDLTSVSSATLKFDQAVNYGTPVFYLSVMISTDYYGDVNTATWYELSLDQWPLGTNWNFINSSANLTQYVGNYVTIAFKYTSSSSVSTTWEVKNFVVEE